MLEVEVELQKQGEELTPVCAIGASAGGVRALQKFFNEIDDDLGLAFVVIIHLSPDHDSQLSEILEGRTRMPVNQVDDTPTLEPNNVYVIAPDRELVIEGNSIHSRPFSEPRGRRAPIDMFFRSVASGRGDGFAVVLSGAGSDGSLGVRKVKEGGGVIFVQDPSDAEYASMPRSAIATGAADFVEPLDRLVERIEEVARSKQALRRLKEDDAEEDLRRIVSFLHARTGHDFSNYKRATVMRRVNRRMQVTRRESLAGYAEYLRDNPEEAQELFGDLLISVTAFFRDPASFSALSDETLSSLFEGRGVEDKIRIWSVGCATGEEPYSLAILLLEEAERRHLHPSIQIFATDLDHGALATAREGRYPRAIEVDVSEDRLRRHFIDEGSHYRIRKEVRDLVLFAHHSALKDPPFMRLDLVICRNLLIYMDRELQRQLLALFHYALNPGGFLFLGSAESADPRPELFTTCNREARIFQAKPLGPRQVDLLTQMPRQHRPHLPVERRNVLEPHAAAPPTLHAVALESLSPPSILVDEDHRVVNLSKNAGRYIRPPEGPLSPELPDLVRPELRSELRGALHRAFDKKEPSLSLPCSVAFDGTARRVVVHVLPVTDDPRPPRQALVLFIDAGPAASGDVATEEPGEEVATDRVLRLEEELKATQERLSSSRREHEGAIQELRVANEELQSINEEYRSTAEELETSKEELQSINEELSTVNSELKSKLDAIASAHSDLQNLVNATEIGTLFLDDDMRIKMLTPALEQLFNVTDSDIGRPITDFTHKLAYEGVERDAAQVMRDLVARETEVATKDGRWLIMRLRPYQSIENRIEGVVVSFVDITGRRETERLLRESEARYRRLFETMDEGFLLAEILHDETGNPLDLLICESNPAARLLLGSDLAMRRLGETNVDFGPQWLALPQQVLRSGEPARAELYAKPIARWFDVGFSKVDQERVAILFQDITERRRHQSERELMMSELNHRVKNMLAVVHSIANQTLRSNHDPAQFVEAFQSRLQALSRAHSLLTQEFWRGTDLRDLAKAALASFASREEQLQLDGPGLCLTPNASISFAMALHELGTNAIKYGALSTAKGRIELAWRLEEDAHLAGGRAFHLTWNEQGGPPVEPAKRQGFGSRMLEKGIARELDGEVHLEYRPSGLFCSMCFPAVGMIIDERS